MGLVDIGYQADVLHLQDICASYPIIVFTRAGKKASPTSDIAVRVSAIFNTLGSFSFGKPDIIIADSGPRVTEIKVQNFRRKRNIT